MDTHPCVNNQYSAKTLIGPWLHQRQIEKDRIDDFLEKCQKGELAIQKVTKLYQILMEETPVKMSTDGCVRYCDNYGLICPASNNRIVELGWSAERPQTILSADCEASLGAGEPCIGNGNEVCASTCLKAVARSVFQIVSPYNITDECSVKFGQHVQFRLANLNVYPERLYLASDNASPTSMSRMAGHQKLFLTTDNSSYLTHWKIECVDPAYRLETEGCPVFSDTAVLIKHCRTNAAIAVEENFSKQLTFGKEYEASCHTYLDGHRSERDVNHFFLATIIPPKEK